MRLALLAAWIALVILALVPLLRRRSLPGAARRVASEELVKDPVCHTYVVRSRAVRRETGTGPRYFCSAECARRFDG